ncbi:hypothetical protein CFBP6600_00720 [Xanthomonas arboricola pv. corylina]|nr:hypothetical protein CFBP6600_00720 [Xanthomonas arboricola pv. corylina]CAE6687000.1 hypothetical protein CFBP6600_00720 [Xanthomonas arboricola pv. corylina]
MVGINNRDAKWHDLYRVDLATGQRTLVEKNTQHIETYLLDGDLQLRYATRVTEDGGVEVLARQGAAWKMLERVPFEDVLTTEVVGLSNDGNTLYLRDSRNRDTAALYAVDTATHARTLLTEDARADVDSVLKDPKNRRRAGRLGGVPAPGMDRTGQGHRQGPAGLEGAGPGRCEGGSTQPGRCHLDRELFGCRNAVALRPRHCQADQAVFRVSRPGRQAAGAKLAADVDRARRAASGELPHPAGRCGRQPRWQGRQAGAAGVVRAWRPLAA